MRNTEFHTRLSTRLIATATVTLLGSGALVGCTAAAGGAGDASTSPSAAASSAATIAGQPAITPRLEGADNFRDLGGIGAGYPTADGGHVARGVVYRSNALTLTEGDLDRLAGLGISEVIDLRTPEEIAAKPDSTIPGASWRNENVLGSLGAATTPAFATAEEADAMMDGAYRTMVTDAAARSALAETLTRIADARGAVIVHCTAGKDRTGWVSALLLHIAGVDARTVDQNYLLTNQYSRAGTLAALTGIRETSGDAAAAAYAPLLGVQLSFLDAAREAAVTNYGSLDAYLSEGLGLSATTLTALRSKLAA